MDRRWLASIALLAPQDSFSSKAVDFVWPDELTWTYGQGSGDGTFNHWEPYDEDSTYWSLGVTWYISGPREVRVIPEAMQRQWYERDRTELLAGFIHQDEEGNWWLEGGALTGILTLLGYGGYRKFRRHPEERNVDVDHALPAP